MYVHNMLGLVFRKRLGEDGTAFSCARNNIRSSKREESGRRAVKEDNDLVMEFITAAGFLRGIESRFEILNLPAAQGPLLQGANDYLCDINQ